MHFQSDDSLSSLNSIESHPSSHSNSSYRSLSSSPVEFIVPPNKCHSVCDGIEFSDEQKYDQHIHSIKGNECESENVYVACFINSFD